MTALRELVRELDLEDSAWIEAIQAEARGLFDEGLGCFAYSYRARRGTIGLVSVAGVETAPGFWGALFAWGADNQRALAEAYRTGPCSIAELARAGVALSEHRPAFEPHGVADVFTLLGHTRSGTGVFVTAPRARSVSAPSRHRRRSLERLCVELSTAVLLREQRQRVQQFRLSRVEAHVAQLLSEGASDKRIAAELGVTLSTVSTFTRRLRRKLGCRPGGEALLLRAKGGRLSRLERLTDSECEVAAELCVGSSYRQIAEQRGVSARTVASQCGAVFRKLGVSGRRELAAALISG